MQWPHLRELAQSRTHRDHAGETTKPQLYQVPCLQHALQLQLEAAAVFPPARGRRTYQESDLHAPADFALPACPGDMSCYWLLGQSGGPFRLSPESVNRSALVAHATGPTAADYLPHVVRLCGLTHVAGRYPLLCSKARSVLPGLIVVPWKTVN